MVESAKEQVPEIQSGEPGTQSDLTRFFGALDGEAEPGAQFAGVANIEILGPRRVFLVQFSGRNEPRARRIAMFPHVEDVLGTEPGGGAEIDYVDMMTISAEACARPTIQRVSTILARRDQQRPHPRFLIVTDAGEIVPVPSDNEVVSCDNYELVFMSGRWQSEHGTRRFCSRQQLQSIAAG